MRGTVTSVCISLLCGCLLGCSTAGKPPAGTKLTVHIQPSTAAPSASSAGQPREPQEWWTDGGGVKRQFRGAGALPPGGHFSASKISLPKYSHGTLIDAQGRLWLNIDKALCMIEPPASEPRRITDPSAERYYGFTLRPDGNLLDERIPLDRPYSDEEWFDNLEQHMLRTQVVLQAPSGKVLWTWPVHRRTSALLAAPDGSAYCIAPAPRDDPQAKSVLYALTAGGELRWELEIPDVLGAVECLALADDGTLYCAGASGTLYAITTDGVIKWVHRAGMAVDWKGKGKLRIPVPSSDTDSLGHFGSLLITDSGDVIYSAGSDRCIYCIAPDGHRRWKFRPRRDFTLHMALAPDGSLYVADHTGWLYKLDTAGRRTWSRKTDVWTATELAVDSAGNIYCACKNLDMLVLDPGGNELYRDRLPGWPNSVALGSDGTFYCTTRAATSLSGTESALYMLTPTMR